MSTMLMMVLVIVLIFVCFQHSISQDRCDPISGPSGESCVIIPGYKTFQLATCTTSSGIMASTNNSFQCADSCRNYCWLPCMLEKHGAVNGSISDDCNCTSSISWCFDKTGSDAFFTHCLDNVLTVHNCSSDRFSHFAYILGTSLGNYLKDSNENCSSKEWIRGFRVCVQEHLAPDTLLNSMADCDFVDTRGFEILELCLSGICQTTMDFRSPFFTDLLDYAGSQIQSGLRSQYVPHLQNITQNCTTS